MPRHHEVWFQILIMCLIAIGAFVFGLLLAGHV